MELEAGKLVTPNVRLVRLLGKGGMGAVWVADHLTLDTQVAVKFISVELAQTDSNLTQRFTREASLAAKIKSPHVVQTFDHGMMDGSTPFIVMELLEGESLGERLARSGSLSLREAAKLVSQVAEVLATAHGMGVVHRDIKPDNIFLIKTGYEIFAKVLDFGVAKQTQLPDQHAMTTTGAMVGTPFYMSPELIQSAKTADGRADIWALGVVAYEAITGRVPFLGETLGSLCIAIATTDFVPPSQKRAGLPKALDQWFARVFARDPAYRFESAKALAETLNAIATELDHVGHASTDPEPVDHQGFTLQSEPPPGPNAPSGAPPPASVMQSAPPDDSAATHVSGAPPPTAGAPVPAPVPPPSQVPALDYGVGGSAPPQAMGGALAGSSPATFEGAARSMGDESPARRRSPGVALLGAAMLTVGAVLAFLVLRDAGESVEPEATVGASASTAEEKADAGSPPVATTGSATPQPVGTRPPSTGRPTGKPPAPTAPPGSTTTKRNCYFKVGNVTKIRPECLK